MKKVCLIFSVVFLIIIVFQNVAYADAIAPDDMIYLLNKDKPNSVIEKEKANENQNKSVEPNEAVNIKNIIIIGITIIAISTGAFVIIVRRKAKNTENENQS